VHTDFTKGDLVRWLGKGSAGQRGDLVRWLGKDGLLGVVTAIVEDHPTHLLVEVYWFDAGKRGRHFDFDLLTVA
jgi:hypothetical protein